MKRNVRSFRRNVFILVANKSKIHQANSRSLRRRVANATKTFDVKS